MKSSIRKIEERAVETRRVLALLHQWGIHSLGQLAALEKQELADRLGPIAVELWERANGKSMRPLRLAQPPESFVESFEFEHEIETVEPLLFLLRRFLQNLTLRLGALYFVAKELQLQLTFDDKSSYEHRFKIPQPTNDVEVLFRMLHTHLENFTSASPIVAVALEAESIKPGQQQFGLFESALRDPTRLSETLARLVGLLGDNRVGTPVLEETHRPDAFRMEPFAWELSPPNESLPQLTGIALRRFRHPSKAKLRDSIARRKGPFMSSGNWWDEKEWARVEWDAELENGAICRCHQANGGWQLDGIYD